MKDIKMIQAPIQWINQVQEFTSKGSGQFFVREDNRTYSPVRKIVLQWQRIFGQTDELAKKIDSIREILIPAYTKRELEFAKKMPEAVANDFMLKSLTPLFQDRDKIDWILIEKKIQEKLEHFFATTDWKKHSGAEDINIFVEAKDFNTGKTLGVIQFLFTPEFEYGTVKEAMYGILSDDCDLAKLLTSSIFKLIPDLKRIFLHIRSTSQSALEFYNELGFTKFPGPLANWTDLEYLSEKSKILQQIAAKLTN